MDKTYLVEVIQGENGTLYFDFQVLQYAAEINGTPLRYLKDFENPFVVCRQNHHPVIALDIRHANNGTLWPKGTKGFVLPLPPIKTAVPPS